MSNGYLVVLASALGLVSLSWGGCSSSTDSSMPRVPARIEVVSGNSQTGVVGAQVASPLVVKVSDVTGAPVAGQLVSFRIASGDGSVVAGAAVTDPDGLAQDRWMLGTAAGAQRAEARIVDATAGSSITPVSFDAVAVAGPVASVSAIAGSGQAAPPGAALVVPLQARVSDTYGNPVGAIVVTFAASAEDGSASPAMAMTDASGIAKTTWDLGAAVGAQRLDATVGAAVATFTATARQTVSQTSDAAVGSMRQGVTPFIEFVQLSGTSLARLAAIRFTIAAKPGTASKPVEVTYAIAALQRRGYVAPGTVTLPVFGLYAGAENDVSVQLQFDDDSWQALPVSIAAAPYVDSNGIYDRPTILQSRTPGTALGFDFFFMKSALGTPVVVDSDGEIRWIGLGTASSFSSALADNGFIIGAQDSTTMSHVEFDGSTSAVSLIAPAFTSFHHNIDDGKVGMLVELNAIDGDGVPSVESNLAEVTSAGVVLQRWDLAALLGDYMRSQGDDPSAFIRPGVDWFHMNGSAYDPQDDSLIVSSRENFLVKIDYTTGRVIWILGDPTKYWSTFPSLRAKALTLDADGFYPIGQHAPSITSDGQLMVFNDGLGSLNQPAGQPAGASRAFSAVSVYSIDEASFTAHEVRRFDYDQTILSTICSSAYEAADKSVLVDYAVASGLTKARLVALDPAQQVVFDFEFATTACNTSWNARPVAFDDLAVE